jgi:hypothetical protein
LAVFQYLTVGSALHAHTAPLPLQQPPKYHPYCCKSPSKSPPPHSACILFTLSNEGQAKAIRPSLPAVAAPLRRRREAPALLFAAPHSRRSPHATNPSERHLFTTPRIWRDATPDWPAFQKQVHAGASHSPTANPLPARRSLLCARFFSPPTQTAKSPPATTSPPPAPAKSSPIPRY